MVFWFSSGSVVMSPFSFMILLIWTLPLSRLVSLARSLSILFIYLLSKKQLLVLLILCLVFFVSVWLISAPSLTISCLLLLLGECASFYTRALRCAVKLLM